MTITRRTLHGEAVSARQLAASRIRSSRVSELLRRVRERQK